MLKNLTHGLSKYYEALKTLSRREKIPLLWLFYDCVFSYLRYGCVLNQYIEGGFYKRKFFERKNILTYKKWCRVVEKYNNPNYIHLLKNKADFNNYFSSYIKRDWLQSKEMTFEEFENFVGSHRQIFIKPIDDWSGNGIQMIDASKCEIKPLFEELKKKDLIIEEVVVQHPDMVFQNKSVNTIRVYSVYDAKLKKTIIIKATLRAGVGNSIVDNSHSGGCSYDIDISHGIIDSRSWEQNTSGSLMHPGTRATASKLRPSLTVTNHNH